MGRTKVPIKPMKDVKSRNITFKNRIAGLTKKIREFSTLCGVDACMICIGPHIDRHYSCETWPKERSEMERIIDRYRAIPAKERQKRNVDLSSYSKDKKKKKSQLELNQWAQEKNTYDVEYPTRDSRLNGWSQTALHELVVTLDLKLESVKARMRLFNWQERLDGREIVIAPQLGLNHVYGTLSKGVSDDEVKLPPLPPSCFDLPPVPIDIDYSSMLSGNNARLCALDASIAPCTTMLQNDFIPGNLHQVQHFLPLIGGLPFSNPPPIPMPWTLHQKPQQIFPQAHPLNHVPSELNGFKTNFNRDMEPEYTPRGSSTLYRPKHCYICHRCLENKDIFMYRDLTFCSVYCRKHQEDMDAEAEKKAEALKRKKGNGNLETESPKPGSLFFIGDF